MTADRRELTETHPPSLEENLKIFHYFYLTLSIPKRFTRVQDQKTARNALKTGLLRKSPTRSPRLLFYDFFAFFSSDKAMHAQNLGKRYPLPLGVHEKRGEKQTESPLPTPQNFRTGPESPLKKGPDGQKNGGPTPLIGQNGGRGHGIEPPSSPLGRVSFDTRPRFRSRQSRFLFDSGPIAPDPAWLARAFIAESWRGPLFGARIRQNIGAQNKVLHRGIGDCPDKRPLQRTF